MTETHLPAWPRTPPTHGPIVLRRLTADDAPVAVELSADPYVPLIGTLPADATDDQVHGWIVRQQGRLAEGHGFSFAIARADTNGAVGFIGLSLAGLPHGRATSGYAIAPSERGRGYATAALIALTDFAWRLSALHRIELYIEAWNIASTRAAERAGYDREGLLRSHQEIGGQRRDMLLYAAIREPDDSRS